jgi:hypothetical protein
LLASSFGIVSRPPQGGTAGLASFFGGTNVVYGRSGSEVKYDAYNGYFGAFSGARVVHVKTYDALLAAVEAEFSGKDR